MKETNPLDRAKAYIEKRIQIDPVTSCWNWTGTWGRDQRGVVRGPHPSALGTSGAAHRVSYAAYNGPIPEGFVVRHRCNNGICVNPQHLAVGTQKMNMQDRKEPLEKRTLAALHVLKQQFEANLSAIEAEIKTRN